jgi:hypothetical protein
MTRKVATSSATRLMDCRVHRRITADADARARSAAAGSTDA